MIIVPIFAIAAIIAVAIYCIIIIAFRNAWKRQPETEGYINRYPSVSVIIPFRNEENSLPALLNALRSQNYPVHKLEIIAVNDHSTDLTLHRINSILPNIPNCRIIHSTGNGKKEALATGIASTHANIILTTDADCLPSSNWVLHTVALHQKQNPSIIIGPVKMIAGTNLLSQFQAMDYMALSLCGAGAAMLQNPVFCSGANLSFRKSDWIEAQTAIDGRSEPSGDDVFLLHAIKKAGKKIMFNKNRNSIVTTHPETTLNSFLTQRMRWGGKSRSYTDASTIALSITVLLANLFTAISMVMFAITLHPAFATCFILKTVSDYSLFRSGAGFYNTKPNTLRYLLFAAIYPFYTVYVALGGLFASTHWKNRTVNKK